MISSNQLNQSIDSPQPLKNKTSFVAVVIIISILIIGGGVAGYFVFSRNLLTSTVIQKPSEQGKITPTPTEKPEISLNNWIKYTDPQNRFSFSYPPAFGTPSRGTNDGFDDRVAAVMLSEFSSGIRNGQIILGGEVALTKGFILVDMQAIGGLYDSMAMGVFPKELRNKIFSNLSALTITNFCGEFAKEHHIDINSPVFSSLDQEEKNMIVETDRIRNIDPKVIRCDVDGDTITFHKEATAVFGSFSGRQNIYGAIRFLGSPFSSFQIVRVTADAPIQEMLNDITSVVKSFK